VGTLDWTSSAPRRRQRDSHPMQPLASPIIRVAPRQPSGACGARKIVLPFTNQCFRHLIVDDHVSFRSFRLGGIASLRGEGQALGQMKSLEQARRHGVCFPFFRREGRVGKETGHRRNPATS
jgi:hypothetical protein